MELEVGVVLEAIVQRHGGAQAGLHDLVGHVPAGGDDEEGTAKGEEVVAQHVDGVGSVKALRGGLREALHHRVDDGGGVAGREAASQTGEGAGDTGQRMTAAGVEHEGRNRHEHHVRGVGHHMAEDGNENDGRGEAGTGDDAQQALEQHMQEAGTFHDADAERSHDGHAQRGEVHEILDRRDHELEQVLGAEHIQHADGLAGAGMLVVEGHEGKGEGQDAGYHQRVDEQHGDVGKFVACGFHSVQEAVERAAGLLDVRRHGNSLK